jgi:hypothetical protein
MSMCSVGVWSFLSKCARLEYGVFLIKICAQLVYGVSYEYMLGWYMVFLMNMCSVGVWSFL